MILQPHATVMEDDVASMGAALDEQLALPTGDSIDMAPNGLHLMCLGLTEPLEAGDRVPIELQFAGRAPIAVSAAVEQR